MLTTYLTLLIAHFIGDFPLQSGLIYNLKISSNPGLALHALIHALVGMLLVEDGWRWWWVFLLLTIIHFGIDWVKLRIDTQPKWKGYIVDQMIHWGSLVPLALLAPSMKPALAPKWLGLDFFFVLLPLFIVLAWIYLFDKYPKHDTTPRRLVWFKSRGLFVSQVIGLAATFFIVLQRIGLL